MALGVTGFLLQCYLLLAAAMYFDLGEQEEKCIIEEVPEDMLVTGYFLLQPWDLNSPTHSPHLGVTVTIRDPNHEILMTKRYGKFGKFTFTAHASGQHFLCFQTNSTRFSVFAGERLKLHLDVQMGEHVIDHSTDKKTKDNMQTLENILNHLTDQMVYITRQQVYQREKEEMFRQISEDTNSKVLWWAVVQTSILLSVGFWQLKRLKDFFIAKKLV
ncbi:transmembrane emp24 domain-containing protein 11 [Thalassophryne amazonica]|uniref:transmembrane emp24 domain-containing protein 11 n=1 Tax=Thalassophryne amazonica TaxID=390379 RepID=UPI001470DD90|nr:transmembrane emp24 domain-containing protein 11 [Thalassophryne amazonica]